VGGIMVVPVGTAYQEIAVITRSAQGVTEKRTIAVQFVPMVQRPRN
jgi:protein-L-isoaspartate O-methyltransferase